MTAAVLIPGLSLCPAGGCPGQLYECRVAHTDGPGLRYHCNTNDEHNFTDADLAACTRCTAPEQSDRVTISQALRQGWLLVEGRGLLCPEHVHECPCGVLYDVEAADGSCPHYCAECSPTRCGECHDADQGEAQGDYIRDGCLDDY